MFYKIEQNTIQQWAVFHLNGGSVPSPYLAWAEKPYIKANDINIFRHYYLKNENTHPYAAFSQP
jgi:hypothetical protein